MSRHSRTGWILAIGGLLLIAGLTLQPNPEGQYAAARTPLWCILCGSQGSLDFLFNVVLFAPLGAGLAIIGMRPLVVVLAGVVLTLGIETTQALALVGRDPSVGDLLANTLGAWLGASLGRTWTWWLVPVIPWAPRLAVASSLTWLALQVLTAWGLRTTTPSGEYYGQWQPIMGGMDVFRGTVVSARVNRLSLPSSGPAPDSRVLRRELAASQSHVEAVVVTGEPPESFAPIVGVAHHDRYHVAVLGQDKQDLIFSRRFRASELLLHSPTVRLPFAFSVSDARVRIGGTTDRHSMTVWKEDESGRRSIGIDLHPSMGWAILLPIAYDLGPTARLWTALWLAAWLASISWWSAGAWPTTLRFMFPGAVMVLGLAIVPVAVGYPAGSWNEWVGACLGWAGGGFASTWFRTVRGVGHT